MMQRDDFEHRLGQGLKRWSQNGKSTLDLEAYVRARLPAADAADAPAHRPHQRSRWLRWAGAVAAAAVLVLTLTATFPRWAGAASGWPLVGNLVTEWILKDAGLKWAYDMGLIQTPMAAVSHEGVTVRVLGAVADHGRTTVFYQVTGWEAPPEIQSSDGRPQRASPGLFPSLARPVWGAPSLSISRVNGEGVASWTTSNQPQETPIGVIGMTTTGAIPTDEATLDLTVDFGPAVRKTIAIPVMRTAGGSQRVATNLSETVAGITLVVDEVIYTPAETIVRYRNLAPQWTGDVQQESDQPSTPWLEAGGERLMAAHQFGSGNRHTLIFPAVKKVATLVFPSQIRSVEANLRAGLAAGPTWTVEGVTITLDSVGAIPGGVGAELSWPEGSGMIGLGRMQVLDSAGNPIEVGAWAGGSRVFQGRHRRTNSFELKGAAEPAELLIPAVNFYQPGPWRFVLPR